MYFPAVVIRAMRMISVMFVFVVLFSAAESVWTHGPLDEVPGLLCARVGTRVVVQHLGHNPGHLFVQLERSQRVCR